MDPLSVTASVIAVVGAVKQAGLLLQKLRSLRNAPFEVLALQNEVTDMRGVLRMVEQALEMLHELQEPPLEMSLPSLDPLVERCTAILDKLDSLVKRITRFRTDDIGRPKVSALMWMKESKNIVHSHQEVRDARQNLTAALTAMSNIQNNAIMKLVLTVRSVTFDAPSEAPRSRPLADVTSDKLDSATIETTNADNLAALILHSTSKSPHANDQRLSAAEHVSQVIPYAHMTKGAVVFEASMLEIGACDLLCPCQCHQHSRYQTPGWLGRLFGNLFFSYSRSPMPFLTSSCNYKNCRQTTQNKSFQLSYIFPNWAVSRAFSLATAWDPLSDQGASILIRIPRVTNWVKLSEAMWLQRSPAKVGATMAVLGASPFDVDTKGMSLLHVAAENYNLEVYTWLAQNGGDGRLEDEFGRSPASIWVDHFLRAQDSLRGDFMGWLQVKPGLLRTMKFTTLHKIILGLCEGGLAKQLARDDTTLDVCDGYRRTPLCWTAIRGQLSNLKVLLSHGADVTIFDNLGFTPLHWAARVGEAECVKALLEAGASANAVAPLKVFCNPLHVAAIPEQDRTPVIELLLAAGADLEAKDHLSLTPLSLSAQKGAAMNAKTFIEKGADLESTEWRRYTPLMLAIERNHANLVEILLQSGARTDCTSDIGVNVIHLAALRGGINVMKLLTEAKIRGIDPYTAGIHWMSPVHAFEVYRDSEFGTINDRNIQDETSAFQDLLESLTEERVEELPTSVILSNNNILYTSMEEVEAGCMSTQEVDEDSIGDIFYNAEEG